MNDDSVIDMTLNISKQSQLLLSVLEGIYPSEWGFTRRQDDTNWVQSCKTYPWYNGRERGFMLIIRSEWTKEPYISICFAENRNGDQIVVCHEERAGFFMNPQDIIPDIITDNFWKSATYFKCLDFRHAAEYITLLSKKWIEKQQVS